MDVKLTVKNLNIEFKAFKGVSHVLRGVNFNLNDGETLGFAGESGCGKTMTALAVMRLVPPAGRITSGEIIFNKEDLLKKNIKEIMSIRGKKISLIFQEPLTSLNPSFKIGWQIEEVLKLHVPSLNSSGRSVMINEILCNVGLADTKKIINSYPHQLSGGMRQRIVISMAIICNPEILIADEPTTALDVTIQKEILNLIDRIKRERKQLSVIFISHDINLLAEHCDRIMIMYMGEIVEVADSSTIVNEPLHPYSKGLIGSTPRVSLTKKTFSYIKGELPSAFFNIEGCAFYNRCSEGEAFCARNRPELIKKSNGANEHFVRCFRV